MGRILFFCVPSVSVTNTLLPVIQKLSETHAITCYNTKGFKPEAVVSYQFIAYPEYQNGYHSGCMDENTSYFEFAGILLNTADSLLSFLKKEVEENKPDLIIISHLALWGKLISLYFKIPFVTLYSTFVLHNDIVNPVIRKLKDPEELSDKKNIVDGLSVYKRLKQIYTELNITSKIDIWDTYVNKGDLNIVLIPPQFQPAGYLFNGSYHFVGSPFSAAVSINTKASLIYVSLGTVLNNNYAFYSLCISVLKQFNVSSVISVGEKIAINKFDVSNTNIKILKNTDQKEILKDAAIFISHGGMASVQEAVASLTPLIIIAAIPEQAITAGIVVSLGIGISINPHKLQQGHLENAINEIFNNYNYYLNNLKLLQSSILYNKPIDMASNLITNTFFN